MVEDFATGWRDLDMSEAERREQLERVRDALARGKQVIGVAQGGRNDIQRLKLALAAYWLLANDHLYFRYCDWKEQAYRTIWWYPQYESGPGRPHGQLVQRPAVWKRDFDAGAVTVDLASGNGVVSGME
jgi:hypothetical protein